MSLKTDFSALILISKLSLLLAQTFLPVQVSAENFLSTFSIHERLGEAEKVINFIIHF